MQQCEPSGLRPADTEQRRVHVVPVGKANRAMSTGLYAIWATRTPSEAPAEACSLGPRCFASRWHTSDATRPAPAVTSGDVQ